MGPRFLKRLKKEIKEKKKDTGFEKIEITEDSFSYNFVDGSTMFDHPFIQYAFMDSWLSLVPEKHVNRVFQEIESRMNNLSLVNCRWYLTIPFIIINAFKK